MADWLPKWLGRHYCAFWEQFSINPFFRHEVKAICPKNDLQILSNLRKYGALIIFEIINRKRLYRLVPPSLYCSSINSGLDIGKIMPGQYSLLIGQVANALRESLGSKLIGIVLYGSVARGTPQPTSDVDVLIVARNLPPSLGERIDSFLWLDEVDEVFSELEWLSKRGITPQINLNALEPAELGKAIFLVPSIFDLKILLDSSQLLTRKLADLQQHLERVGIEIKTDRTNIQYVDFNLTFGEEVTLAE